MSLHKFREVLICSFSEDSISEEEVLILHEECGSRNCFPSSEYEPFNLANFNNSEARAEFRADNEDTLVRNKKGY